jgi:catechol 1,2-dioxygenase
MQRRSFLKDAAISVFAVGTSGFVRFDGNKYVGDCETTTDILGPFYRPDSPIRTSLVIEGDKGVKILLAGKVKHNDCKTPYKKAKVELWHCSATGEYDNTSIDFRYRGTTFSDDNGNYHFNTILPVPYGIGNGITRPAHFHLMITAKGYQPFVTQLYFAGDEYLANDPSSSASGAKRRILSLQTLPDKTKKVDYDISMSPKLAAEPAVISKLAGVYKDEKNNAPIEFIKKDKSLWMKNQVFGYDLEYIGSNSFQIPKAAGADSWIFKFELLGGDKIKVTYSNVIDGITNDGIAMKN